MTQDDIHTFLKSKMVDAGFLSVDGAAAEGWTTECHNAWQSYAYHKLGASAFNQVPNSEEGLAALFPEDAATSEADAKAAKANAEQATAAAAAKAAAEAKAAKDAAEAQAAADAKAAKDAADAKTAADAAEAAAKKAAATPAPAPRPRAPATAR
jgi:hypothetical protein